MNHGNPFAAEPGTRPRSVGLSELGRIRLSAGQEEWLAELGRDCGAAPAIRERFRVEARDLLALERLTGGRRLRVQALTAAGGSLRAVVELKVPVPVMPAGGTGELRVEPAALLLIQYPAEAVLRPLAGTQFIAVARPACVWHPAVSAHPPQVLCCGPRVPAGIRLTELVLLAYQALCLQGVARELDALNPAGVLNPPAAAWWQANTHRLPLTREPFVPPPPAAGPPVPAAAPGPAPIPPKA